MEFSDLLGGASPRAWDELAGDRLYSTRDWLHFCSTDVGGSTTTGAVHAEADGAGRAAVPVTAVEHEPNAFYQWHTGLTRRGLPAPDPIGLMVGQRRGYQTHLLTDGATPVDRAAAPLLERLRKLSGEIGGTEVLPSAQPGPVPCTANFLTTEDAVALRTAGVRTHPVLWTTDAWIPVHGGGWEDWLAALPSKGRRDSIKREVRAFTSAGYEITRSPLSECYREAAGLLAATQKRYGHPFDLDVLTESFRIQAAAMGPAAQVLFCAREGEPPVGFCLFYIHGDTFSVRAVGFDYQRLRDGAAEYFNLVYYEPVRIAAESGLRWIHPGIEAPDAKARRGARLRPLWLLDLTEDSALLGHDEQIRAHNAELLRSVEDLSPVAAKQIDRDLYAPFC